MKKQILNTLVRLFVTPIALSLASAGYANASSSCSQATSIVPLPQSIRCQKGFVGVDEKTTLVFTSSDSAASQAAQWLQRESEATMGLRFAIQSATENAASSPIENSAANALTIRFIRTERSKSTVDGEYKLIVDNQGARVLSASDAGLFYGAVSLWQMLELSNSHAYVLPFVQIDDYPRFTWRGMLLDSARHYQPAEFIKKLIDVLAVHKINVLHWHLTDDQAWRLEIKHYPRLTAVGAWRVEAGLGPALDIDPATHKPRLYGGFYTQEQVRDIVRFAHERQITVVPEIEMPGHASAAIVAYPELSSADAANGQTTVATVPNGWGVFPNLYSPRDATFTFIENVLSEVVDLFPSQFIHVGGDEAVKQQWKASPAIQAQMHQLGLKDEDALQSWFIQKAEHLLNVRGRRLVGWDEILEGGLAKGATVMSWRGIDGAVNAAKLGHDAILAAGPALYFDARLSAGGDQPPGRGGIVTLADVYAFNTSVDALTAEEKTHLLGVQGQIWTEHIRTTNNVEFMAFPRELAVAEHGWSSLAAHDWPRFARSMPAAMRRLHDLHVNASDTPFRPVIHTQYDRTKHLLALKLDNPIGFGEIHYTLDGSPVSARSPLYRPAQNSAIVARVPFRFQAGLFADNGSVGSERKEARGAAAESLQLLGSTQSIVYDEIKVRARNSHELAACPAPSNNNSHDPDSEPMSLEDDAPINGARAVFMIDIRRPCWIYPDADLSDIRSIQAVVGQLPYNFAGDGYDRVQFPKPQHAEGELAVRLDSCSGDVIATLPLTKAVKNPATTELDAVDIRKVSGKHNLCLKFAQVGRDPMWAIDEIRLIPNE